MVSTKRALLASEQTKCSVIDTMLFKCKQERRLLSAITRLISSGSRSSDGDYALFTILPRALGTEVFRGRSRSQHWGWSVTLVGPSARCQQRQKPRIFPTYGAVTPSIQVEGAEHIFRGVSAKFFTHVSPVRLLANTRLTGETCAKNFADTCYTASGLRAEP